MSALLEVFYDADVEAAAGLAFDEAMAHECAARAVPGAMLRIYTYKDNCVLVGRFQRIEAEVDLAKVASLGIEVNRRPTGGGAILMGSGQLGVAFCVPAERFASPRAGFHLFSEAIVAALGSLGIKASLRGKNDVEVSGRKIAGLGFCLSEGGLLFHASILADIDLEMMASLLQIPLSKLSAYGPGGIAERITTLHREAGSAVNLDLLREAIVGAFEATFDLFSAESEPLESLTLRAKALARDKYETEAWLFDGGRATSGEFLADCRSRLGTLRLVVASQGAVIKSAVVTGDFNAEPKALIALEEALRWVPIEESLLSRRIADNAELMNLLDPAELAKAICASHAASGNTTAGPRRIGSCYIPEEKIS